MAILGIDPGLATCGWALMERTGSKWRRVDGGCWRTTKKQGYIQRVRYLARNLREQIAKAEGGVVFEMPDGFSSGYTASVVFSGVATIVTSALAEKAALYYVTVRDVKQWAGGEGSHRTPKAEVEKAVRRVVADVPAKITDHEADAMAIVLAHAEKKGRTR